MNDREKTAWLQFALTLATAFLAVHTLTAVLPLRTVPGGLADIGWITIWVALGYLAVLSWRAAYLAGKRSNR